MDENRIPEEEFKFTEETPPDTSVFAPTRRRFAFGRLNIRNILIISGIILTALVLYKFAGFFMADKEKRRVRPSIVQPGVQPEIPKQPTIAKGVTAIPQVTVPPPTPSAALPPTPTPTPTVPTEVPPTGVSPTEVPPTGVPPTGVPPTGVPPTGVPPTGVPPTGVPPTGVPPTGAPPTGAPPTGAPPTGAPPTGAPTQVPPPVVSDSGAPGSQINQLQQQLSNLANTVTSMQNTLTSVNNTLSSITASLQQQQVQIEAIRVKKIMAIQQVEHVALEIPKPIYFIHAMIPGRAWLLTPEGFTITVSIGDLIPGYGYVRSIDPPKGIIITSTNAIIRYND